ncbi:MAG: hypothetical protein JST26_11475 [Bacteroidetes bacterium]|nr:hypothetical protein [Bacteroidota bacterium]
MAKTLKTLPIQSVFIQKLKEILPPNVGLAEELADVLDISLDSAYRRIRGETDLSIDEVFQLTKKYAISIDSVFSNLGDTVTFTYTKLTDNAGNFEHYLSRILSHLKTINSFHDKRIFYVAEEVPLFFSFYSKKLIEFKLFYWQRSVLNVPDYQGKKFEYGVIPKEQVKIAQKILEEYKTIPSVEIWTNETILTATKQVEYYFDSGVFKNKDVPIELLEEFRQMIEYIRDCAETTRKDKSQPEDTYLLYNSDVVLGTNCIYVQTGESNYAYVSFNTLNSLTTNNREFCEETEHWVKNLERKSTLISGVAEKQRFQFFNRTEKHIDSAIERIKNH